MKNGWAIPGDIESCCRLHFRCRIYHNYREVWHLSALGARSYLCASSLHVRYTLKHLATELNVQTDLKRRLVCGKGFPSVATRAFASRLERELDLPTLMLADCNPAGLMIMLNYRQGSTRSSLEGSEFGRLFRSIAFWFPF